MDKTWWRLPVIAVLLCAACGDSGSSALHEGDPLHEEGIRLPPPKEWKPLAQHEDPEMFQVPTPPPFSPEIFPCSRCHVGGPEVVDTAPAMPHQSHLKRDLLCADCHMPEDEDAAPQVPEVELCFECHDDLEGDADSVKAYFASIRKGDSWEFPRRWDLPHAEAHHVKHRKAGVECAQCHGEPGNGPYTKPKSLVLMQRCIDCHEERNVAAECATCHVKYTDPNYHKIVLRHAENQRGCLDCHNPDDRDTLRLANGTAVPFTESYRLCGQCHGPQLRDWKNGLHGKRKGMWDGKKEYLLCVHCHENPHAPQYPKVRPDPPPTRPEDIR